MSKSIYPNALRYWKRPSKKRLQKLEQILDGIQPLKGMLFDQCFDCFPSAEMHRVAAETESNLDWLRDHITETLRKHKPNTDYPHQKCD